MTRNRRNPQQLKSVLKRAFTQAKAAGTIPAADLAMCNRTMAQVYALTGRDGDRTWRRVERRVAARYSRATGTPIGEIDWEAVIEWIKENLIPLIKLILTLLPMFIADGRKR